MASGMSRLLLLGILVMTAVTARGIEFLPDPTKPAIDLSVSSNAGGAGLAGAVSAASGVEAQQTLVKQGLQSVIISPQRKAAVINGQMVELGDKVGDARLIEVRETSVILQGAQGRRTMELYPGVHLAKTATAELQTKETGNAIVPDKKRRKQKKNNPAMTGLHAQQDERATK